jgi:uncharacterized protein YbbC (DUF1343 family)
LFRGLNVTAEQNKTARLDFAKAIGGIRVEFWSGDAGEEQLAEEVILGHRWETKAGMKKEGKRGRSVATDRAVGVALLVAAWAGLAGCGSVGGGDSGGGGGGGVVGAKANYKGPLMLGIDVLEADGFAALRGKRVGLITNQTSVNRHGVRTRQVLHRSPEVNLVALYVPEHGLDGREKAAKHIATRRDPVTGLTAYSLYGETRKPTASMLRGIDVMVFDLQDIGSRSYTYVSTMALAMEACGENGKAFMVLDRPNPLGGVRVQGPPIERRWISFVGQIPVPYLHGMTTGELARMSNAEGWMASRCRLTVVPMRGWNRGMTWRDTGLRWVQTSPNIPKAMSPFYYASTGIFGSLSGVDVGAGASGAFEYARASGVNGSDLARRMNSLNFPGVNYTPSGSGVKISIDPRTHADLVAMDVVLIDEVNRRMRGDLFGKTSSSKMNIFNKVYGSASLQTDLRRGVSPGKIIGSWGAGNREFGGRREKYLLYE